MKGAGEVDAGFMERELLGRQVRKLRGAIHSPRVEIRDYCALLSWSALG